MRGSALQGCGARGVDERVRAKTADGVREIVRDALSERHAAMTVVELVAELLVGGVKVEEIEDLAELLQRGLVARLNRLSETRADAGVLWGRVIDLKASTPAWPGNGTNPSHEENEMEKPEELRSFLRGVAQGDENVIDVMRDLSADGEVVPGERRVVLTRRPATPERMETPPRAHQFHEVEGFAAYLAQYAGAHTVILADLESQRISAVLDETQASGVETVFLVPQTHPLFEPWDELLGMEPVEVMAFAEFVMRNRRAVVEPNGRDLAMLFSQIHASSRTTMQRGQGKTALNGVMVETVIQGQSHNEVVELPDEITLELPIYVTDASPRRVVVDLLVCERGGKITVSSSAAGLADLRVRAFLEMLEPLRELDGPVVSLGSARHVSWEYVKANPTK